MLLVAAKDGKRWERKKQYIYICKLCQQQPSVRCAAEYKNNELLFLLKKQSCVSRRRSHGGQGHGDAHGEPHESLASEHANGGRVRQPGRRRRRGRGHVVGGRSSRLRCRHCRGWGRGDAPLVVGLAALAGRGRGDRGRGDGDLELHAGGAVAGHAADEVALARGSELDGGASAGVGLDGVGAGAGVVVFLVDFGDVVGRRELERCGMQSQIIFRFFFFFFVCGNFSDFQNGTE